MMWKKTVKAALAVSVIAFFGIAAPVFAQDEEPPAAAEQKDNAAAADALKPKDEKVFWSLFKCSLVEGSVEIRKFGEDAWVAAVENRYYPLGSSIRTRSELDAPVRVKISFGIDSSLEITNVAEVATRPIEIGDKTRTVELRSGMVNFKLPRTLKDGYFFVEAPYFKCSNLAGESWIDYTPMGDGDEAVVHCKTGTMTLEGRSYNSKPHYKIMRMEAAHQVRIRSTTDDLFSCIRGESGSVKIKLAQGKDREKNFETGNFDEKDVPDLEYDLAPKNAVKIFRRRSPDGGNMVVSMMTFDAAGNIKNRRAFAEGRSNVNSGELAPKLENNKETSKTAPDGGAGPAAAGDEPAPKADAEEPAAPAEEPAPAPAANDSDI